MIDDIEKSKCRKIKLSSTDEFCLDVILDDMSDNQKQIDIGLRETFESAADSSNMSKLTKNFKPKKPDKKFICLDIVKDRNTLDKYFKKDEYCKKHINYIHTYKNGEIIVDPETDKLIGHVFIGNDKKETGFITGLYVDENYRGYGLGNKLLDDAINKYGGIDLVVYRDNEIPLRMYRNRGFVPIGYGNDGKKAYWMKLESELTEYDKPMLESYVDNCDMEPIGESTSSNKIPIYIVSYHYGSGLATATRIVTKSYFNHVSFSLTSDLEQCYTFSRNIKHYDLDRVDGFAKEPLSHMIKRYGDECEIKVNKVFITKKAYTKLEKGLDYYIKNGKNTRFDYINLLRIAFGIEIKQEDLGDKDLNCSVFIDKVLKDSGSDLTNKKPSNLVTPEDLASADVSNDNVITVYSGKATGYDMYKINGITIESTTSVLTEATFIEAEKDDTKYYPVFVFLSYTGTPVAKVIKAFTHDPYSHSSISFDTTLNNMISFNFKGMVDEDIMKGIFKTKESDVRYSLYMYMATAEEYASMKNFVNKLLSKRDNLKYSILGLTNFIFGRGSSREDKFFCSEFVASVITAGNNKIIKKQPYMTSPYYFAKNKNFIFIKTGILKNYNSKIIDKLVAEKIEEGGYTNVVIK